MVVALYLTVLPAPRLYGVEIERFLDPDELRDGISRADVLIADTVFDAGIVMPKSCCMLKNGDAELEEFAKSNGYGCVDAADIIEWFSTTLKVDVSRRARGTSTEAPKPSGFGAASSPAASAGGGRPDAKSKMYDSLATELKKSGKHLSIDFMNDAKVFDLLMQAVRGNIRSAEDKLSGAADLQNRLADVEAELFDVKADYEADTENINSLLQSLKAAAAEWEQLLTEVSQLSADGDLLEFSGTSVKAKAAIGLLQKLDAAIASHELRPIGSITREFLACVAGVAEELKESGVNAMKSSSGATSATHQAALAKAEADRAVAGAMTQLEQLKIQNEALTRQLADLNAAYQQQVQLTSEAENKLLLSGGASLPALQEQIQALRAEIESKNTYIMQMEDANRGGRADEGEDTAGEISPEVARGIIRQLRTQVAALKLERDRALNDLMKAKRVASKENERAESLSVSAKSLVQVAMQGAKVSALPPFKYTAKALIIPVFGNGSCGVTSAAVSLGRLLGVTSRTVLVDFDIVTTDMESRFATKVNPLVKMDELDPNSGKNTAMGLFIERGKEFFTTHFSELVTRVESNKAGILDYLPGFYEKPDLFNLTEADYSMLLNYLGSRYDYIVLDLGKIGCSQIGDEILRNFCLNSFRSLIISDASIGKARAMRLKLNDVFTNELRQVVERAVWVVNRATTREDLTRFTAPASNIVVPVLPEMVGVHDSFHRTGSSLREFKNVVRALAGA